jgi:hypothetical protein
MMAMLLQGADPAGHVHNRASNDKRGEGRGLAPTVVPPGDCTLKVGLRGQRRSLYHEKQYI